jgi:hypothetical protein
MAVRDQIISEQREVISNVWRILGASGLSYEEVQEIAHQEGILMQGFHDPKSRGGSPSPLEQGGPPTFGASQLVGGLGSPGGEERAGGRGGAVSQSLMGGMARYRWVLGGGFLAGEGIF